MRYTRAIRASNNSLVRTLEERGYDPEQFAADIFRNGYTHVGIGETHTSSQLHAFTNSVIPTLRREAGLTTIYLEIESTLQDHVDRYLATGDVGEFQKVIERHQELGDMGYATGARYETGYFDILETAREQGIRVVCFDEPITRPIGREPTSDEEASRMDDYKASFVSKDGTNLIYAGSLHLNHTSYTHLGYKLKRKLGSDNFFAINSEEEISDEEIKEIKALGGRYKDVGIWLRRLLRSSDKLRGRPVAFYLNDGLDRLLYQNSPRSDLPFNYFTIASGYDGLVLRPSQDEAM